ncbi:MAG: FAD-dependent oxidoreductase, partial [Bacteroidetes bacterium]|nr:FAD-dependent oxidoreductase [Bacteroidota bacterium]
RTGTQVEGIDVANGRATVSISMNGQQDELAADKVLIGIGMAGNTDGLGLEDTGVTVERSFIQIDERMATSAPGVYAIGDVTGRLLLAHVASAQGVIAAEAIAGREPPPLDYEKMPRCTYCQPQVASLGLTEAQARERGIEVKIGSFPYRGNGKAIAMNRLDGVAKLVADAATGEILGYHIIGQDATELLAQASLASVLEATPRELGWAVQAGIQQPLDNGWRFGARLAGDWKRHPKIPNYDLMQIPRDPGNSSAYNLGLGLSRTIGQTTYGLDLIYEPIWSHTWADALDDTPIGEDEKNGVVRAGEMTVENFFRFDNSILRFGVRQAGDRFDFGLGLSLHSYRYHLDQEDFVLPLKRKLEENWSEWTLSLGLGYNFTGFQLRYLSLITLGTGRPGVDQPFFRGGFGEYLGARIRLHHRSERPAVAARRPRLDASNHAADSYHGMSGAHENLTVS